MESRGKATFAVTHWPGIPVPVPRLFVPQVEYVAEGVLLFALWRSPDTYVDIPDELYLKDFRRLDAGDDEAVLDFCRRFGPIGEPDWSDLPSNVDDLAKGDAALRAPEPWESRRAQLRGERPLSFGLPASAAELEERRWIDGRGGVMQLQTTAEITLYQDALLDMVTLRRWLMNEIDLATVTATWRSRHWHDLEETVAFYGAESLVHGARRALIDGLDAALTPYHVRLQLFEGGPLSIGHPRHNVYQAMCLQLANHIAEGLPYLTCDAKDCSNLFVRTEGYSRFGQNRLRGNKYCSQRCANRVHQQAYRRRQAAKKRNPGPSRKSGQDTSSKRKEQP